MKFLVRFFACKMSFSVLNHFVFININFAIFYGYMRDIGVHCWLYSVYIKHLMLGNGKRSKAKQFSFAIKLSMKCYNLRKKKVFISYIQQQKKEWWSLVIYIDIGNKYKLKKRDEIFQEEVKLYSFLLLMIYNGKYMLASMKSDWTMIYKYICNMHAGLYFVVKGQSIQTLWSGAD